MLIALAGNAWSEAVIAAGHELHRLPAVPADVAPASPDRASPAPLEDRLRPRLMHGRACVDALAARTPDFLLDANAAGAICVGGTTGVPASGQPAPSPPTPQRITLLHNHLRIPLVSHLVDPITSCMSGLPEGAWWSVLNDPAWLKLAFDKAQAREMTEFGITNVGHMPMAAPDLDYDTRPLDVSAIEHPVSFVGSQSTNYYSPAFAPPADTLLAGALAHSYRAAEPDASFFDIYHHVYRLAAAPRPADSARDRLEKFLRYSTDKLAYSAQLWVRQRNRFVLFLARQIPDRFSVYGENWGSWSVDARPPVPTREGYLRLFRRSLININLHNGNTETGLNLRTFEITAAGGFMLCVHTPELEECFEVGRECDAFRSERELLDKIRFYAANPSRAAQIARAGQQRTLRDHLQSHRLAAVIKVVGQLKQAAARAA